MRRTFLSGVKHSNRELANKQCWQLRSSCEPMPSTRAGTLLSRNHMMATISVPPSPRQTHFAMTACHRVFVIQHARQACHSAEIDPKSHLHGRAGLPVAGTLKDCARGSTPCPARWAANGRVPPKETDRGRAVLGEPWPGPAAAAAANVRKDN